MTYELWDNESANILGSYADLNELVAAAYGLGQANPTAAPFLTVSQWSDPGQYTSPRTEPFVLGHITWPDGNLRIVPE